MVNLNVKYVNLCIKDHLDLYNVVLSNSIWNNDMKSRQTLSFGIPYNSSHIFYKYKPFPQYIENLSSLISEELGFYPNNVLINFYIDGGSKMGFHSDDISVLAKNTGVGIISLGSSRIMRFKDKSTHELYDIELEPGSLIILSEDNQKKYLHSILKSSSIKSERISLSFREIRN